MEDNGKTEVTLYCPIPPEYGAVFGKMSREDLQALVQKASGELSHPDPRTIGELKFLQKFKEKPDCTNE